MSPFLETFHKSVKSEFTCKEDVIVAIIHFFLLSREYRLVGEGEKWSSEDDKNVGSECLPSGWNNNKSVYTYRYIKIRKDKKGKKLLLKIVKNNHELLANFLLNPGEEECVSGVIISPSEHVTDQYSDFNKAFINTETPVKKLESQLISEAPDVFDNPGNPVPRAQPKDQRKRSDDQTDIDRVNRGRVKEDWGVPEPTFPRVGGADLDPFSHGQGGGMLINPNELRDVRFRQDDDPIRDPRGNRLPPGAVPPGARFDPFGPPGVGPSFSRGKRDQRRGPHQGNPDNDMAGPPDGYDDMFM